MWLGVAPLAHIPREVLIPAALQDALGGPPRPPLFLGRVVCSMEMMPRVCQCVLVRVVSSRKQHIQIILTLEEQHHSF